MSTYTKGERLSAIHLAIAAKINAEGYAEPQDQHLATIAALELALHFAKTHVDLSVINELEY